MMKRTLILFIAVLIIAMLTLTVSASENIYTINGFTFEFAQDSAFTTEQQVVIVETAINKETVDSDVTTYNLLCTLFGHKSATESFTIIEHCVSDTAPRCLQTLQDVTACTRCDAIIDIHTVGSVYIFCCD